MLAQGKGPDHNKLSATGNGHLTSIPVLEWIKKERTMWIRKLTDRLNEIIRGKEQVVEMAVVTLVSGGHLLIEDVPGVGKTTLLNHILSGDHGVRAAVLVNDFGAINIDSKLIVDFADDTVELANGCVCCTIRDDLVGACIGLLARACLGRGGRQPARAAASTAGAATRVSRWWLPMPRPATSPARARSRVRACSR